MRQSACVFPVARAQGREHHLGHGRSPPAALHGAAGQRLSKRKSKWQRSSAGPLEEVARAMAESIQLTVWVRPAAWVRELGLMQRVNRAEVVDDRSV